MRRYYFLCVILLFLLFPLDISAASFSQTMFVYVHDSESTPSVPLSVFSSAYQSSYWWNDSANVQHIRFAFNDLRFTIPYWSEPNSSGVRHSFEPTDCKLHLVTGGRDYVLNSIRKSFNNTDYTVTFYFAMSSNPIYIFSETYDTGRSDGNRSTSVIFYAEIYYSAISIVGSTAANPVSSQYTVRSTLTCDYSGTFNMTGISTPDESDPVVDATNRVDQSVQAGNQAAADRWEEDRSDATQAGTDITEAVANIDSTVKSKWEILWYPITFTNQILSVFTGGTSTAAYSEDYDHITGYRYDEASGLLIPYYDYSRAYDARASGGSSITFPAFELPGVGQIWDSYTFDLSTIKDNFGTLFNLLYVAITILELYWFVGFLRDKYEEVFG